MGDISFKFSLGDRVKDRMTGFTGIVTSQTAYLNFCHRFGVQPEKLDKDGKVREAISFDEQELDLLVAGVHTPRLAQREQPTEQVRKRTSPGREAVREPIRAR